MLTTARGFVLQRHRAAEADVTFDLLTEAGSSVRIRAHGILSSKRRSGLITEPAALVEVVYYAHGDAGGSLKEGRVLDRFEEAKTGYEAVLIVSHLLELCSRSVRGVEGGGLFTLLEGSLVELRARAAGPGSAGDIRHLLGFVRVRLARLLGVLSDPASCTNCGDPLGSEAVWLMPEVSFQCTKCSEHGSVIDGQLARMTDHASREKYSRFRVAVPASQALVPEWDTRLLRCAEHFLGAGLRTAPELYRRLGSSG